MKKALVLGGGIQGCCIALMLKKHGYEVNLLDKSKDILNRASLNQEGKIHLGFNYGADTSLKTGQHLLLSALYFAPYLEYLLDEKIDWEKFKSTKLNYLVAKDSILSPEQVDTYFKTLQDTYLNYIENENLTYLGERPKRLYEKTSLPIHVNPNFFQACFTTEEVCLHPENFNKIIKQKVQSENISLCLNQHVTNIQRSDNEYVIETNSNDVDIQQIRSDLVFSCLWEGNMTLDKKIGIEVKKGYNLRLKYGIVTKSPIILDGLPSFTIIQGPYGDHIRYQHNKETFFCWYPSSMKGMIVDQSLPLNWEESCDGNISNTLRQNLINENYAHFHHLIPTLPNFEVLIIKGGVIVANGYSDIHDRNSKLHERNEFPIVQKDGYFSITTGKFTNAPYNTHLLEKILGHESIRL